MARKGKKNTRKASGRRRDDDAFDWQTDRKGGGWFWRLFKFGLVVGLWCALFVGAIVAWYAAELPKIVQSSEFERRPAITMLAVDGSVVARYGELKGNTIEAEDMPPDLIHAVLAVEDRRFYKHFGIDPLGILRALVVNTTQKGVLQGGSTITQQLAKNLFLTQDRTLKRKIQEAVLAVWLEQQLTKDEIMTAYLNRVYMGSGAYGVEAAARVYFNKKVKDLDLQECAMLAGVLKAPSRYSPLSNPQNARSRMKIVLAAMAETGYITKESYEKIRKAPPLPQRKPTDGESERYYTDWIMSELVELIGAPEQDMVVQTTLWPRTQEAAENVVNKMLDTEGKQKKATQSAVVMMDIDGAVRTMVGGRDYAKSQFNRATQSLRQPGSTFKPIVYLTALESGWNPNDIIDDHPIQIGRYRPANFKNEYYGPVPLHFALSRSLNSAAIQLIQTVGIDAVVKTAMNLGIRTNLEHNISLALGSSGIPVIEMVTAYATIANGGVGVNPYAILSVKDSEGRVVYERRDRRMPLQVVRYDSVEKLAGMMQETIDEGTGRRAQLPYLAAGKTGTSQDYRDAWFMGFSGRFATGVWVGNDDNSSMKNVTGGSIPASIWRDVMMAAYNEANALGVSTTGRVSMTRGYYGDDIAGVMIDPNAAYSPANARAMEERTAQGGRRSPQSFGELLQYIFE